MQLLYNISSCRQCSSKRAELLTKRSWVKSLPRQKFKMSRRPALICQTLRKNQSTLHTNQWCLRASFHFLLHQVYANDEASTRLLQVFQFLLLSTASLIFIPCAFLPSHYTFTFLVVVWDCNSSFPSYTTISVTLLPNLDFRLAPNISDWHALQEALYTCIDRVLECAGPTHQ